MKLIKLLFLLFTILWILYMYEGLKHEPISPSVYGVTSCMENGYTWSSRAVQAGDKVCLEADNPGRK